MIMMHLSPLLYNQLSGDLTAEVEPYLLAQEAQLEKQNAISNTLSKQARVANYGNVGSGTLTDGSRTHNSNSGSAMQAFNGYHGGNAKGKGNFHGYQVVADLWAMVAVLLVETLLLFVKMQ